MTETPDDRVQRLEQALAESQRVEREESAEDIDRQRRTDEKLIEAFVKDDPDR